jgi:hypothetical protein
MSAYGRVFSLEYTDVSEVRNVSIITVMMEAVRTSETSVYSKATRRYIPEGSHLHTRRRENLKSHLTSLLLKFQRTI